MNADATPLRFPNLDASQRELVVIVPTFNESENIRSAVVSILENLIDAHVLIVDDDSPDGTGAIAEVLSGTDARVHVLHRAVRTGLAGAYLQGFEWALDHGFGLIGEFDADGSHPASALPAMVAAIRAAPEVWLVIGSRWTRGGSVENWPKRRAALSRGGNAYARAMLGLKVHDATAGFRIYTADALRRITLEPVDARGYGFQVELTRRVHDAGGGIVEVPIHFREREIGTSKMSGGIVLEAMWMVTGLGLQRTASRLRTAAARRGARRRRGEPHPTTPDGAAPTNERS